MGLLGRNKSKSPAREQAKVNVSDRYNAMQDPPPPPPAAPAPSAAPRRRGPSSRSRSSSRRGNATSTAGYQYALKAYSETVDPNENSNVNTMLPNNNNNNQSFSTATAFVGQSHIQQQGTSVPASLLTSSNGNINTSAANAYNRGNANRNGNGNNASPQETLNAVHGGPSLTYSNSESPDKTGYQHQQLNHQQQDYNSHNSNYNYDYMQPQTQQQQPQQQQLNINTNPKQLLQSSSSMDDYESSSDDDISPVSPASSSSYSFPQYPGSPSTFLHQRKSNSKNHNHSHSNSFLPDYNYEPEMVDTTYAEHYGDAYTGKPIRYIYPQGYGSMRPRSRPWQIALVMFTVLAWLNVFIVGHCADRFESQNYNDDKYQNGNVNDDAVVIETKWCGNRNLYFTWVLSVALTGLSFAYCSIIGYVKARDFAVANGRSQPPGMVGKSDYYVQEELGSGAGLEAGMNFGNGNGNAGTGFGGNAGEGWLGVTSYQNGAGVKVKQTIYQADGTPRFFGGQIYKPTQAAVSLTSR